ncbi:MAG: hypothetical protein HGA31_00985 [Candidatus Moranbacteria bacterium]|nr:hypothetical protein [Candidatus Moranbacteria bacterium]
MHDTRERELRNELDEIYTPLEEAKEEIWRRWNDKQLRERVIGLLGGDIPDVMREAPRAILSRQIPSPNFETLHFVEMTKDIGIRPAFFKYNNDKFVTKNEDKYYLAKMYFLNGIGKNGGRKLSSLKAIDIDRFDGKFLIDIRTLWGEGFIDFHDRVREMIIPSIDTCDISGNYERNGGIASKYYSYYITLFVCHGILFENYLLKEAYGCLTSDILLPAFKNIVESVGLKPLIVRLVPSESEEDVYWRYYPEIVENRINDIIHTKTN